MKMNQEIARVTGESLKHQPQFQMQHERYSCSMTCMLRQCNKYETSGEKIL